MYYLAYGMNTNLDSMKWRCPHARSLGKVTLNNHKLAFRTFCDIVYQPGAIMECALWEITDHCEMSLDALEGYPNFYGKKEVTVEYAGRKIIAMIYYMKDLHAIAPPSQQYLDTVADGYDDHDMDINQLVGAFEELAECISS
jgi:gamma-glutamylcyclotransferase (GGCT)/AIG2-like uncharacterized protein YtfP